MSNIIDAVLSVLFPKRCPCCGEVNTSGEPCESCAESLEEQRLKAPCCLKCGAELIDCSCGGFNPLYTGVVSVFENEGAAKNGIYGLKFYSKFYAAEYFGQEMAKILQLHRPDIKPDVLCIVPMTAKERREKTCDQVDMLAKNIIKNFEIPYEPQLISKVRQTARQHKLAYNERATNVKGAFSVKADLKDKIVVLVDDIKTSGHTLSECAKQLRLSGAKEVWCLTALNTANNSCKEGKQRI